MQFWGERGSGGEGVKDVVLQFLGVTGDLKICDGLHDASQGEERLEEVVNTSRDGEIDQNLLRYDGSGRITGHSDPRESHDPMEDDNAIDQLAKISELVIT